MKIEDLNYEQLREALSKLPMTWYPDLIRAMIEAAMDKGAFHPMLGVSRFAASVERDWHTKHRSCPSCGPRNPK